MLFGTKSLCKWQCIIKCLLQFQEHTVTVAPLGEKDYKISKQETGRWRLSLDSLCLTSAERLLSVRYLSGFRILP